MLRLNEETEGCSYTQCGRSAAAVQFGINFGCNSHLFMIIFTFSFTLMLTFRCGKEQTNLVSLTMDALVSKAHFYPTVNGTHINTRTHTHQHTHSHTITHLYTHTQTHVHTCKLVIYLWDPARKCYLYFNGENDSQHCHRPVARARGRGDASLLMSL